METMEARLKIDEIARNFVKWRNNNDASRLRGELYSPDIESTEEGNTSEIGQVKGMEGLKKKGQGLSQYFEVHEYQSICPGSGRSLVLRKV